MLQLHPIARLAGPSAIVAALACGGSDPTNPTLDEPKFYLAENGVTIMCPDARLGETGTVDGVEYTRRNRDQIFAIILGDPAEYGELATTCTTGVPSPIAFGGAEGFNEPIGNWDVSSMSDMSLMFAGASSFNQPIGHWDVTGVREGNGLGRDGSMMRMFDGATSFNQPLDSWDVSNVIDMRGMFSNAASFNHPLDSWDVSSVTDMSFMFWTATSFNQPLNGWDVGNVTTMRSMFGGQWGGPACPEGTTICTTSFNQPLDAWDVSSVTDMSQMFAMSACNAIEGDRECSVPFNQDLSAWCVQLIPTRPGGFDDAAVDWAEPDWRPVWGTCPG